MNSWENIILHWINCLLDDQNDNVKSIEDLQDEQIYYKLISKVKSWDYSEYDDSHRNKVLQFLKNEYPNYNFNHKNDKIEYLYVALLILSRLSLEPIFHKSLCTNLQQDIQVKIKTILESVYSLGKNVTNEDLSQIFSFLNKSDSKVIFKKPKFVLEEFLNSPVTRSVHNDNKIYEQAKQIRHLRAELETMRYEKSELIEDIKSQEKQIQELKYKLQETLTELKLAQNDTFKMKEMNSSLEFQDQNLINPSYEKELKSLENYVADLQKDNCQLQDEKLNLESEIKICKSKCHLLKEKNLQSEQMLESLLLQVERKDDELTELRIKNEELQNYLKEKSSNIILNNQSYEGDDRIVYEASFNKSETLSSVIEIQLQDTKIELINMQNKFKYLDSCLTIFMEEYEKLKRKVEISSSNNHKKSIDEEKIAKLEIKKEDNILDVQENLFFQKQNKNIENKYLFTQSENCYCLTESEIKLMFATIYKNNSDKSKYLFTNFLNILETDRSLKKLESNISLKSSEAKKHCSLNLIHQNTLKLLQESKVHKKFNSINPIDKGRFVFKIHKTLWQQYWREQLSTFLKMLFQDILKDLQIATGRNDKLNKLLSNIMNYGHYTIQNKKEVRLESLNAIKNTFETEIKSSKLKEFHNNTNDITLINGDFSKLHKIWTSLFETISNDIKIYKVLLLLKKVWFFALDSLKCVIIDNSYARSDLESLLKQKTIIETELKNVNSKNMQILSFGLIYVVQFVSSFVEDMNNLVAIKILDFNLNLENVQNRNYLTNKIVTIKKKIENLYCSINSCKKIEICNSTLLCVPEDNDDVKIRTNSINEKNIGSQKENINSEVEKVDKVPDNDAFESQKEQFERYLKEIHEKYEMKLEKMKEKMKSAYSNQITMMRKEQEIAATNKIDSLQSKIEKLCYNHTEELKKYKKHISELTTQLWDVGEKLIIEKQKREEIIQKFKEYKTKCEGSEVRNTRSVNHELENHNSSVARSEIDVNASKSIESNVFNKMHTVRGFQIMGNAFKTEDEEGEVFDTTYLTDVQNSRSSISTNTDRLSILQLRNAKCKPHLKSSYPVEMQFYPTPLTEDEIKIGTTSEEVFNDSLSQSLLTGKKVKRKDRTRTGIETPKRNRRFSNIFRKPRSSIDHK